MQSTKYPAVTSGAYTSQNGSFIVLRLDIFPALGPGIIRESIQTSCLLITNPQSQLCFLISSSYQDEISPLLGSEDTWTVSVAATCSACEHSEDDEVALPLIS